MTIRRLAEEIEYSQPVFCSHFENRDAIAAAVALEGFVEVTAALRAACTPGGSGALERAARAYLAFAAGHRALRRHVALPTDLRFAEADTGPELRETFSALRAAVPTTTSDADMATKTLWAALHGLAELAEAALRHVWTALPWQGAFDVRFRLVGAAMRSACWCGARDRWP